jgi:hypothetical protein
VQNEDVQNEAVQPITHQEQPAAQGSIVRVMRTIGGWSALVVGFLTFWLPIPIGLPLMALGVMLIGPDSPTGRKIRGLLQRVIKRDVKET